METFGWIRRQIQLSECCWLRLSLQFHIFMLFLFQKLFNLIATQVQCSVARISVNSCLSLMTQTMNSHILQLTDTSVINNGSY